MVHLEGVAFSYERGAPVIDLYWCQHSHHVRPSEQRQHPVRLAEFETFVDDWESLRYLLITRVIRAW